VLVGITSIRLFKDNHDSCVTCTTSVECKTIIIAVLMVMSGMDPHMISGNLGWVMVKFWLGYVEVDFIRLWVDHGETP
jgi:predicted anti-sigma-YlaC factor YlaD